MSYQHATPFASLGKSAGLWGDIKDAGNGLYNSVAGASEAVVPQGLQANVAGTLGLLNGGFQGGASASNQQWNQDKAAIADEKERELGGQAQMYGAGNSLAARATRGINSVFGGLGALAGGGGLQGAVNESERQWNAGTQAINQGDDMTRAGHNITKYHGAPPLAGSAATAAPVGPKAPQKPYVAQGPPAPGAASMAPAPNQGGAPPTTPFTTPSIAAPPRARIVNGNSNPGFTVAHQDQFRKMHGGAYDPNSRMDRQKMQGITKTAFAMLEKEAGSPASFIADIARKGGGALRRAGAKARINTPHTTKPQNTPDVINLGPSQAAPAASSKSTAIIPHPTANTAPEAMPGDRRMAAGNWLKRLVTKVDDPTVARRINYGAGTIAGGGALYGAHSMGHNSGRESGVLEGTEKGMELGIQGAQAMQPGDPGFLGRLGDLFTGTQAGPDAATMRQGLNSERDKLVKAILEG